MRRIIAVLWLPIVAMTIVAAIYGGLNIADLKNQNQNLDQKQKKLEKQIAQLEDAFNNSRTVQVAGIKDEQPKAKKTIPTVEPMATSTPQPSPAPTATPTPTPTRTSTPTPTPTLTATPTAIEQATVAIENVGTYAVNLENDDTAFSILLCAGQENGFSVDYQTYEDLGAFVNCIAGICSHDNYYWAFYYNAAYSMVGAGAQPVVNGDTTTWKFESF